MSFITEAGKISIYLCPCEGDSNKAEVKIDEESKARFDKLEDEEKKSLGKSCLLGGKSVLEAIKYGSFEKNGSVSTELTETKDVPSALMQIHQLPQNKREAERG